MNDHLSIEPRWHGRLAIGLSLLFLTLAGVSHTIALRYVILLLMLVLVAKDYPELKRHWREQRGPIAAIGAFLLFALLHSLSLSMWPEASASEFRSQLLMGAVVCGGPGLVPPLSALDDFGFGHPRRLRLGLGRI